MIRYNDRSGSSGILYYQIGKDFIEIKFKTEPSAVYVYTNKLSGKKHIDAMKKLAARGEGLSTYIAQHPEVRDRFERH
jgi:hypothetical protein